jgi:phosphohistidine phosphatase
MKTITLLRHAKSSWDDAGAADIDRPLSPRGKRDCKAVREVIAALKPELVLCSSALRTRETLERIKAALPSERTDAIEARLYLASAARLLARLKQVDDAVDSVLLIGHNPGLQRLALLLAGRGDAPVLTRLAAKFPTAAIARLAFSGRRWRDLDAGAAELKQLWSPKDGDGG